MKRFAALICVLSALYQCALDHAHADSLPGQAAEHLPQLLYAQKMHWPDAPMPSFLAAQVEQESCITLRHPRCWNPRAELKTSREYGFGFGQITVAYAANGAVRFNKFEELRAAYPSLRGWTWENRYSPEYQLTALVEMDHGIFRRVKESATSLDQIAFTLSAYNGGESGVRQDRLLCQNTKGCDRTKWFENVERTSLKNKKPYPGYRLSPFAINRSYVTSVIYVRRCKYVAYFRGMK